MIHFGVKRLPIVENGRRYHLYDTQDQLILVADHGSPWLPQDPKRHVRFARPDGHPVASLDLPSPPTGDESPAHSVSYAIIFDHAVYAILNEYDRSLDNKALDLPYFVLEAEGKRWLACGSCNADPFFALYDQVPAGLSVYTEPQTEELPDPVGLLEQDSNAFDLWISLPNGRFRQGALLSLALVFLIDRFSLGA